MAQLSDEKNLTIVKTNKLIEASYRLSIGEQRLLLACIGQVDSVAELKRKEEFTITAKEFANIFNIPLNHSYGQIEEAAKNLFDREITIKHPRQNKKLVTRWVSDVEYDEDLGQVTLGFAPKILPYISQIKGKETPFTKYNLEYIANLKSVHAIRIYELCRQFLKAGIRVLEVDDLKNIIGVENLYPEFKDLNKRVLKPSIDQINKHTDINVKMDPVRQNRKIVSLKFEIKSKQLQSHKVSKQKSEKEIRELANNLTIPDYIQSQKTENQKLKKPSFKLH